MATFHDIVNGYLDNNRHRTGAIIERTEDRIKSLLRQTARQTEEYIHANGRDMDYYQRRLRSTRAAIEEVWRELSNGQTNAVRQGRREAVILQMELADEATKFAARELTIKLPRPRIDRVAISRDLLAYIATHPEGGVALSDRIWQNNRASLDAIFNRFHRGMLMGEGAAKIARDIRTNLIDPEGQAREMGVIRRLRTLARKADAAGDREKARQLFAAARTRMADLPSPGRGKYRSAHANAMRVARSEIVRAQQEMAVAYGQRRRHVVGFEWRPSPGTDCEICLGLAGRYDKGSVPSMPHPHCICDVRELLDEAITGEPVGGLRSAPAGLADAERRAYWTARAIKQARAA